ARDEGGEGRYDHPAASVGDDVVERFADHLLRWSVAGGFNVDAVGEEAKHTFSAEAGEGFVVGQEAVHGGGVELEVARVDDGAERRVDGEEASIGDGVADVDEFDAEWAQFDYVACLHYVEACFVEEVALTQLVGDQADR